jgi:DNA end-binding protein Ku
MTLRYPYEVRKESDYSDDIPDEKLPKDMLDLAAHIVDTKRAHFNPDHFKDEYESALKQLVDREQRGERIEGSAEPATGKVINLMDALRRSVESGGERGRPMKTSHHTAKRAIRATARGRKAS